jgi:hypothetical protein
MKTLSDLIATARIPQGPLLESKVQKQCVDWAKRRGYWARKFSSQSQRSVPDYIFKGRGIQWFTEFKREGCPKKLIEKYGVEVMSTEAQYEEQLAMRAAGWVGFECDNFLEFTTRVAQMEKGQCL